MGVREVLGAVPLHFINKQPVKQTTARPSACSCGRPYRSVRDSRGAGAPGKGGCERRAGGRAARRTGAAVVLRRGRDAAAHGGGALALSCSRRTRTGLHDHRRNPDGAGPDAVLGGSCHGEKYTVPGEQGKPKQKQCVAARQLCVKEMSKDPAGLTNGFHRVPLSLTRSSLC